MKLPKYTTWDLVAIVVIGVGTGALNGLFSAVWSALFTMGGPYLANIIFGIFYLGPLLAIYLVRKPGAALVCGIIQGLVEMVAGTPFGVAALGWTTLQALGIEAGFAAFGYRQWGWGPLALASFLAGPLNYLLTFFVFGLGSQPLWGLPPYIFGWLTGIVLAGVLGKLIGDALKKTGVTSGLAISQTQDPHGMKQAV
jgi:energy-coupling factor transport system substrate-specific component